MNIHTLLGLAVTSIILMAFGIVSVIRPREVSKECHWVKYKWLYLPSYKESTNVYYLRQIQIVGVGLIGAAVIMLIFTLFYVIYPNILTFIS